MDDRNFANNHSIILENRSRLNITGIYDVLGFDEETVTLDTSLGRLTIKGQGLKVDSFAVETGSILIEGTVAAIVYTESQNKRSALSRLFK